VDKAKSSGVKVLVDVNWRPMFWPDPDAAKPIIEVLAATRARKSHDASTQFHALEALTTVPAGFYCES
jgi:hypothetical protein